MKIFIIISISILIFVPAFPFEIQGLFINNRDDLTVYNSLQNILHSAENKDQVKAWVFFSDKGFNTLLEFDNNLMRTQNNLTERCRARRMKARGHYDLVDFGDIPVYREYIARVKSTGAKIRNILRWFNAVTVEANPDQLNKIAEYPFVRMFKSVRTIRCPDLFLKEAKLSDNIPIINTTLNYGLSLSQLAQQNNVVAHELGFAGAGVLVCMLDTGFLQDHISFQNLMNQGRVISQWDFVYGDDNTDYDDSQDVFYQAWHGTMVWSTIAGEVDGALYGSAYQAMYCLAKTENVSDEIHLEEDNWAAAAEWADSLGADIISSSLGYRYAFDPPDTDYTYEGMNGDSTIVTQAADLAVRNGIAVLTAMGNSGGFGPGSLIAPSDGDSVISVGAVDSFDVITEFSSLGPTFDGRIKPEVCARGQDVLCALASDMNDFTYSNGTSLSTPLTAGAAAILLSAHPNWTPMMVREALMMTATRPNSPDNAYGWGIIDVGKALFYHPQGDIVIDHGPLVYFPAGQTEQTVAATIFGGAGINPSEVYLFWRTDSMQTFNQIAMTTDDGLQFEGGIPGQNSGTVQYYISAIDNSGINTLYPFGAPGNYFSVQVDSTLFIDSFENGLYYWKTSGTGGLWAITAEEAATGNISITDSPARNYNNNVEAILTGKSSFPLVNSDSATVSFQARYELQTDNDFVIFEISIDDGLTWQQLGPRLTGTELNFHEYAWGLNDFLGHNVKFRFKISTDGQNTRDGIYIDNFEVRWHTQTSIADGVSATPSRFGLDQNCPNPFNSSTTISYSLPRITDVEICVYDLLGKHVETLYDGAKPAGYHQVIWDARDVSSGVYFCKLQAGDYTQTRKMVLLR